jgi:hypothetical protein
MASLNACHRFTSLRVHQVTVTHLLCIDGYSAADQMVQKAECIESRAFSAGGHKWRLRFFPNGYESKYVAGPPATMTSNTWPNRTLRSSSSS